MVIAQMPAYQRRLVESLHAYATAHDLNIDGWDDKDLTSAFKNLLDYDNCKYPSFPDSLQSSYRVFTPIFAHED